MLYQKESGMLYYCPYCNFGCMSEKIMNYHKEAEHKKELPIKIITDEKTD